MEQWSPDGKWIAYSDWRKIYRVSADGGAPEKLMTEGDNEVIPSWSPDGKSIVFNRFDGFKSAGWAICGGPGDPEGGADDGWGEVLHPVMVTERQVSGRHGARATADGDLHRADETVADTDEVRRPGRLLCMVSRQSRHLLLADRNSCRYVPASVPDGVRKRVSDVPNKTVFNEEFVSVAADGQPAIMSHCRSRAGVLAAVEVSYGSGQSGQLSLDAHFSVLIRRQRVRGGVSSEKS